LLLKELGIPVPEGRLVRSFEEATNIARELGFPLALKAQAAELPHKSDAGGVVLGIDSERALLEGWTTLHRNLRAHRAELVLDGVLVERMGRKGVELIVGAQNDPDWGPVLLVGFGGLLAEAIHDARLLPPHLSCRQIEEELYRLPCSALLRGFRGSPALDVSAVARIISALSRLIRSTPEIEAIDINPLVVYPQGQGALALDALIAFAVK
jgi:acyl-CoA synthetase (NDP forming)